MAKAKSTRAAARGRPRRARGKAKKKFSVSPEVHRHMGMVFRQPLDRVGRCASDSGA